MVLGGVVSQFYDMSLNRSTRAVYQASFRAFRRVSVIYPVGNASHTHPPISEEIIILFFAYCYNLWQSVLAMNLFWGRLDTQTAADLGLFGHVAAVT